jgi:hypothetical protein
MVATMCGVKQGWLRRSLPLAALGSGESGASAPPGPGH